MSQSDQQLLLQSRYITYALVAAGCAVVLALLQGLILAALLSASLLGIFCVLVWHSSREGSPQPHVQQVILAMLSIAILLSLNLDTELILPWVLLPPLLFGALLPVRQALAATVVFALLALFALHHSERIFEALQYSPVLLLSLGIVGAFAFLRDLRQQQLQPLRRTDNLTMAASLEHLVEDLAKEIQRSEREGSELAVIALAIDQEHSARLDPNDLDTATMEIGRLLHNSLRLFDSYYLWKNHQFLIVLPHTSSAQAVKIANTIRIKIRKELSVKGETLSVSMGVSGLNVGDEPQSLTRRAESALASTQAKASNRTLLYREAEPDTRHEDDTGESA